MTDDSERTSAERPSGRDRLRLVESDPPTSVERPGASSVERPSNPEPERVGDYIITGKLGEGGMGVVLSARDPDLDRPVAIKLLRPGAHDVEGPDATRARMLREAQAMAKLSHPNVVNVYRVGLHGDQTYVAMELVDGVTLREWVIGRSPDEIVEAYLAAGQGLAAAHDAGLVHRDFKPDNTLVGTDGRVRVTDFGLVTGSGEHSFTRGAATLELNALVMTQTGTVLGTPVYMAPEQHRGDPIDERADQFAFCVALYEALCGERPFTGATHEELVANVLGGTFRSRRHDQLAAHVRDALLRGLSPEATKRFSSMPELLAHLRPVEAHALFTGIWDGARRRRIRAAFVATNRSHANDAATRVERFVDLWMERWIAKFSEATSQKAERVLGNLRRHARMLDDWLEQVARHAPSVISRLSIPFSCLVRVDDADEELSGTTLPSDPIARERIDAILIELADAGFLARIGVGTMEYQFRALADEIVATDLPALRARLLATEHLFQRDPQKLVDALPFARAADEPLLVARIVCQLVRFDSTPARIDEARQLAAPIPTLAFCHSVFEGTLALLRGLNFDGIRALQRALVQWTALARFERTCVIEHALAMYGNLASSLANSANVDEARSLCQRAIEWVHEVIGPDQVELASLYCNAGVFEVQAGRLAMAEQLQLRGVATFELWSDPSDPILAVLRSNLADTKHHLGRHAECIALLERAVPHLPAEHLAKSLVTLGMAEIARGTSAAAIGPLQRAAEVAIDASVQAMACSWLGVAYRSTGDAIRALPRFAEASRLFLEQGMVLEYLLVEHDRAITLASLGRRDEAITVLERSDEQLQQVASTLPQAADVRFTLARYLHESDPVRARALAIATRPTIAAHRRAELERWLRDIAPA